MVNTEPDTTSIPYIPYAALKNLLVTLSKGELPARIDNSVLENAKVNRQYKGNLAFTLRYLKLVNATDHPTDELRSLTTSLSAQNAEGFNRALSLVVKAAYPFLFESDCNIENATEEMVKGKFQDMSIEGVTQRKAIAFVLHAAKEAGIVVSPHLKIKTWSSHGAKQKARPRKPTNEKDKPDAANRVGPGSSGPELGIRDGLLEKLMEKFPEFDPGWDKETQEKWFTAYQRLLSLHFGGGSEPEKKNGEK